VSGGKPVRSGEIPLVWPQNIILVGFMATGKSHVGRILSGRTGWVLSDTDAEIVRRTKTSIHQIFQEKGEDAFRILERSVLLKVCAASDQIIVAGGGAFVDSENRQRMLGSGLVFCLSARAETIHQRLNSRSVRAGSKRPLLMGANSLKSIQSLLADRAGAYAQANYVIETDFMTPEQVVQAILRVCYRESTNGRS
jgi:shikimate kinase